MSGGFVPILSPMVTTSSRRLLFHVFPLAASAAGVVPDPVASSGTAAWGERLTRQGT